MCSVFVFLQYKWTLNSWVHVEAYTNVPLGNHTELWSGTGVLVGTSVCVNSP